jgi:1-acyl-sn-glycerol-3-phosphate acyltransferase
MDSWQSEVWYRLNFSLVWVTYTFGFSFRSRGFRNMPKTGPVLILANHESYLDPLAVGLAVRRRIRYLARKPLFHPPVLGPFLKSVGCVPVDQVGVAKEGLRTSIDLLNAGKPLLVFPEGRRTADGKLQSLKAGIALILKRAPVPIVPVGIAGAYEAFPINAKVPKFGPLFWPYNGASIAASVGKVIPPERYRNMEREELLQFLSDAITREIEQAERLKRKG